MSTEPEYSCNKWLWWICGDGRCAAKPYCEVYIIGRHSWSYLCRLHFIIDKLHCWIFRIKTHVYYILDKDAEGDRFVE